MCVCDYVSLSTYVFKCDCVCSLREVFCMRGRVNIYGLRYELIKWTEQDLDMRVSILLTNILKIFVQRVFLFMCKKRNLLYALSVTQHFDLAGIIPQTCTVT